MSSLNGIPVGSGNLISYKANISLGLRRHEPILAIISVGSFKCPAIIEQGILSLHSVFYETLRLL